MSYRCSSLMPPPTQAKLRDHQTRKVSTTSNISVASSSVSDFLAEKLNQLQEDQDFHRTYRKGLQDAKDEMDQDEYQGELDFVIEALASTNHDLNALQKSKRIIEKDIDEAITTYKRDRKEEPDVDFYERAYANSIVPRVMTASGNQKRVFSKHQQAKFRKDVLDRYGAAEDGGAWCHLTGWWPSARVKAAHLVSKSLTGPEISYLFGEDDAPLEDPRNGISLLGQLEMALDKGLIVIIPSTENYQADQKWKCVLVDKTIRNNMAASMTIPPMGEMIKKDRPFWTIKYHELDERELVFLTPSRPARRYLYFRFIITYLNAKRASNDAFTSTVENKKTFWASPGPYLERSTLTSLARNISGLELPPSLTVNTFGHVPEDELEADDVATNLSCRLRKAAIESGHRKVEEEQEGEDDEDEEDNEDDEDEESAVES